MPKLFSTVLCCLAAGVVAAPSASAAQVRFTYDVDGDLTLPVPGGVSSIDVRLGGGAGGKGTTVVGTAADGGRGARIDGRLSVTPGQSLTLRVDGGGAGGAGNAQPGGAGGAMAALLSGGSYLVVAGGGGGGAGGSGAGNGGDAGAAGADGGSSLGNANGGGAGLALTGGAGGALFASSTGSGFNGAAGTANAGGAGGASPVNTAGAGGGGGGGIFGGGGGGSVPGPVYGAGGGGGGASFVDPQRLTDVTQALSADTDAFVRITYDDTTAPQPTLAPMTFNPDTLTGVGGADLGDADTVKLTLSSGQVLTATVGEGGAYSVALPSLPDGAYTVTASQADVVGNTGTTARTFIVDTVAPTIDAGKLRSAYDLDEVATAEFTCADANTVAACEGPATVDTTSAGAHELTITARDAAGNVRTEKVAYTVTAPPLILDLSLTGMQPLGPFVPGMTRDYTASGTALITSTASSASFSVVDSAANAPGHLVNGTFVMPSPLRVQATSAVGTSTGAGALSGTPRTLLDYPRAVGADAVTLTFTQPVTSGDALRTGTYGKTLTYTLATTTP